MDMHAPQRPNGSATAAEKATYRDKTKKTESSDDALRVMPQALNTEKSVLSLMLTDPSTYILDGVNNGVIKEYFYLPAHQMLWTFILERSDKGLALDITSLTQALADAKQLDALGGHAGLTDLFMYATSGAYFDDHLQILKQKYVLRTIIHTCTESCTKAFALTDEFESLLDTVETDIMQIRDRIAKGGDTMPLSVVISKAMDNIERSLAKDAPLAGISSSYHQLDEKINGLKGGEMFVIAARPSMGKTSLLLNIVEHVALRLKLPTLVFSCEMTSVQLVERLLSSHSGVSRASIRGKGTKRIDAELKSLAKTVVALRASSLIIDDTAGITITELRAKAKRVMLDKKQKLGIIGVDYLQLMRSTTKQAQNNREREVAEISAGLKALAKELDVPIVALAQLNRLAETRTGSEPGKPRMSDLRESGAIEQDADMIGLLWRKGYYENKDKENTRDANEEPSDGLKQAQLILAKNRNGPVGTVFLSFDPPLMRFIEREPTEEEKNGGG